MKKSDFTDSIYSSKLAGKFSWHKEKEMIRENLNWSTRGFPTILFLNNFLNKEGFSSTTDNKMIVPYMFVEGPT